MVNRTKKRVGKCRTGWRPGEHRQRHGQRQETLDIPLERSSATIRSGWAERAVCTRMPGIREVD